jgi:hypothetical protein
MILTAIILVDIGFTCIFSKSDFLVSTNSYNYFIMLSLELNTIQFIDTISTSIVMEPRHPAVKHCMVCAYYRRDYLFVYVDFINHLLVVAKNDKGIIKYKLSLFGIALVLPLHPIIIYISFKLMKKKNKGIVI